MRREIPPSAARQPSTTTPAKLTSRWSTRSRKRLPRTRRWPRYMQAMKDAQGMVTGGPETRAHQRANQHTARGLLAENMAERVGFEPTVGFPQHSLSRRALSTAQTPLRGRIHCSLANAPQAHNIEWGGFAARVGSEEKRPSVRGVNGSPKRRRDGGA